MDSLRTATITVRVAATSAITTRAKAPSTNIAVRAEANPIMFGVIAGAPASTACPIKETAIPHATQSAEYRLTKPKISWPFQLEKNPESKSPWRAASANLPRTGEEKNIEKKKEGIPGR